MLTIEHSTTLQLSGANSNIGLELYGIFQSSGLPAPTLRLDGVIGGGQSMPACEALAEAVRSLLPAMERFGVATAAGVEIDSLALGIRDEVLAQTGLSSHPY